MRMIESVTNGDLLPNIDLRVKELESFNLVRAWLGQTWVDKRRYLLIRHVGYLCFASSRRGLHESFDLAQYPSENLI